VYSFFSLGAIAVELFLARQIYREKHRPLPADLEFLNEPKDETGTVTSTAPKGFFSRLFSKRRAPVAQKVDQDNVLPEHTTPGQLVAGPRTDSFALSDDRTQIGGVVPHGDDEPQIYGLYTGQPQPQGYAGQSAYSNQQRYDAFDDTYDQVSPQSPQRYTLQETYGGFDYPAQTHETSNPYTEHRTGGYQPAPDYRYEDGIYDRR
jgi:hypothetical protein